MASVFDVSPVSERLRECFAFLREEARGRLISAEKANNHLWIHYFRKVERDLVVEQEMFAVYDQEAAEAAKEVE